MGKSKKKTSKGNKRGQQSSSQPPPPFTPFTIDLSEFVPEGSGPSNVTADDVVRGFNELVDEYWEDIERKDIEKGQEVRKIKKKGLQSKEKKVASHVTTISPDATTSISRDAPMISEIDLPSPRPVETNEPFMFLVSRTLHFESNFPIYDEYPSSFVPHLLMDPGRSGTYVIDSCNKSQNSMLTCLTFDYSLLGWLEKKTSANSHWDDCYDIWNSIDNRMLNKVTRVRNWDSRRLAEDTRLIIESILKAVVQLHSKGEFHGFLDKLENYVFKKNIEERGGIRVAVLQCFLTYQNTKQQGCIRPDRSIENDMMCVDGVIFNVILDGSELTGELKHLRELLGDFRNLKQNFRIIADHPSLWFWERRFCFYELIWMKSHERKEVVLEDAGDVFRLFKMDNFAGIPSDLRGTALTKSHAILNMLGSLGDVKGWRENLPEVLSRIQKGRFERDDSYTVLNFLRVAHFHYLDKRLAGDSSTEEYYVLESDGKDYRDDKYFEVLTSESVPLFLVRVYAGLCGIYVSL